MSNHLTLTIWLHVIAENLDTPDHRQWELHSNQDEAESKAKLIQILEDPENMNTQPQRVNQSRNVKKQS